MRVLFSTHPFAFQNPGGGEQVFRALRTELKKSGIEVDTYSPWKPASEISRYDVIHYFSTLQPSFWHYLKTHAPKTALVITPIFLQKESLKARVSFWTKRQVQRNWNRNYRFDFPDHWLPATPSEAGSLNKYLGIPKTRISVHPHGVEDRFAAGKPDLFLRQTGLSSPFILHVGRFHPVKNQLGIIQALSTEGPSKNGLVGVFIGSPDASEIPYYEACLAQAKRTEQSDPQRKQRFLFIPRLDHDDALLASAYAAAHTFTLPSEFETYGITALEAALAGCRLVLTKNMLSIDSFQNIARFVDPKNTAQLAQEIQNAMAETATLTEKRDRAKILIQNFGWPQITQDLVKIYNQVIAKVKTAS